VIAPDRDRERASILVVRIGCCSGVAGFQMGKDGEGDCVPSGADTVVVSATSATQRGAIWARQTLDEYPVLTTEAAAAMEGPTHGCLAIGGHRVLLLAVSGWVTHPDAISPGRVVLADRGVTNRLISAGFGRPDIAQDAPR
jgi:hypothetical protein